MISRRSIRSWVAAQLFLFVSLPAIVLSQGIDNNPTGPTGVYNGNITTAGNYDPSTGNQLRIVDDLVVPGSVGAYPLKWTRYSNTRAQLPIDGPWTFSYTGYRITDTWAKLPDGRQLGAPWVEEKAGAAPGDCSTPWSCGTIVLADGGRVEFEQQIVLVAPVPPSDTQSSYHVYRPIEVIDPYGQVTKLTYITRGFYQNTTKTNPSPIYVLDKVTVPHAAQNDKNSPSGATKISDPQPGSLSGASQPSAETIDHGGVDPTGNDSRPTTFSFASPER